jgi:hypothetical protein
MNEPGPGSSPESAAQTWTYGGIRSGKNGKKRWPAEVLLGVIDGDPLSQRSVDLGWRPSPPSRQPGRFTLTDLLAPA